jgi:alginate O-acetyltransferase complex protein AlgI
MLFHSATFLGFFAVVFPVYWLLPRQRARLAWLLAASAAFYMSWNPRLILLILFSAGVDYAAALAMRRVGPGPRRALLVVSISVNLGLLAYFKYANFFLDNLGGALGLFDVAYHRPALQVLLPLGISFYTFETISYVVDVYRCRVEPVRNPLDYALFILFFPHLVAGPIVRPRDFLPQLTRRIRFDGERCYLGARLFLLGLFKKAVLADTLAGLVDPVFAAPGDYAPSALWWAMLGYAAQIYGDFSGYSDMGIGLAHLFGIRLPANFRLPYLARGPADFWRRWHISLSSWLRDYLYIPLGGSRGGAMATYRNLMIVMLLGGLWHGASWTFVAWGLYHGILLAAERAAPRPAFWAARGLAPLKVAGTFLLVCVGWVLFRAPTFADAGTFLAHLAVPGAGRALEPFQAAAVLACVACVALEHLALSRVDVIRLERRVPAPVMGAALAAALAAVTTFLPETGKAFIYFQF